MVARALCACEASVRKAATLPELAEMESFEAAYSRAMIAEWQEKSNTAIARAVRLLPAGPVEPARAKALADDLVDGFVGWPSRDLQRLAGETVANVYRLAAQLIARRVKGQYKRPVLKADELVDLPIELAPNFSLVDHAAVESLTNSQVFWLRQHFSNDTVIAIQDAGLEDLAGMDAKEAGEVLRNRAEKLFGVGAFDNMGRAYFSGVATNAATTARVTGSIFEMRTLGVSHYTFIAVDDERTTEICRHLDGKTFKVVEAAETIDEILGASNPDEVRKLHGWKPDTFNDILAKDKVQVYPGAPLSPDDASKVVAAGFAFPPLHFRCRSMVDIAESSEILGPEPPVRVGLQWDPEQFKIIPGAKALGGVNPKIELEAPDGSRWLFKPYTQHADSEEYRAYADKLAADVANVLEHPTAEVHVVTMPKGHPALRAIAGVGDHRPVTGSIQRMASDVAGAVGSTPLKDLSKDQLLHIQKEHAFDWLISNHDGHLENILIRADGSMLGIDKGQAFKYFGRDRLHWSYSPNAGGGFHAPYMNEQAIEYAAGKMGRRFVLKGPAENPEFRAFLEKIRDLPDDQFIEILKPYASRAAASGRLGGGMTEEVFYRNLLFRKKGIVEDFDLFYKDLNAARKASLPPITRKPKAPPASAVVTPLDDAFVKDIDRTGWEGKSLFVADVDSVKSGNILVYGMDGDGTILETYLTAKGDDALARALGDALPLVTPRAERVAAVAYDSFAHEAEILAKSLVAHLADEKHAVYDGKIKNWDQFKNHIQSVITAWSGTGETQKIGAHYLAEWTKLLGKPPGHLIFGTSEAAAEVMVPALKKALETKSFLKKFVAVTESVPTPVAPPKALGTSRFTVRKVPASEWNARIEAGRIKWTGSRELHSFTMEDFRPGGHIAGDSWEIEIPGSKTKIVYTPHSAGAQAKVGRLRIMVDQTSKGVKREEIEEALSVLRDLGVKTDLAAPIDMEAEYLRKVTRVAKVDQDPGFSVPRGLPSAEVVERLAAAWSRKMGVEDVRKLKNYNPLPEMRGDAGWGRWYRFDVKESELGGYQLKHDLTGSAAGDPEMFFRMALGGARSMIASETKLRVGLPPSGMSPAEDMRTGGAFRVFTRIASEDASLSVGEFRFSRRPLLDADNLIFTHDKYGNVSEDIFREYHSKIEGKSDLRRLSGMHDNEVCVNQTLSWDFIQRIGVQNESQKRRIVEMLKDAGVTKFGDIPVEDALVVRDSY